MKLIIDTKFDITDKVKFEIQDHDNCGIFETLDGIIKEISFKNWFIYYAIDVNGCLYEDIQEGQVK